MALESVGSNGLVTLSGIDLVKFVPDLRAMQAATDGAIGTAKAAVVDGDAATLSSSKSYADQRDEEYRNVDRALWREEDAATLVAAKDDATTRFGGLPARVTAVESKNTAQDTAITAARTGAVADAKTYTDDNKWLRPGMPGTADFNTYTAPGEYGVSTGGGKTNIPQAISGRLRVGSTGAIVIQEYSTGEAPPKVYVRRLSGGTWTAWSASSVFSAPPVSGVSFDTMQTLGTFPINLGTHPNQPAPTPGTLEVLPLGGARVAQRFTTDEVAPRVFQRRFSASVWGAWSQLVGAPDLTADVVALHSRVDVLEAAPNSGVAAGESPSKYGHTVRLARAKQIVGVRTATRAQVTLICDHGSVKFRDLVYPALQASNLKCTLALNSQKMEGGSLFNAANEVDTWAQVKTWANAGIEIANHGRTHNDTDDLATLEAEIVGGHQELEAALNIPIHSWVQPSAAGDLGKWFGFNDGISWEGWANSHAGRLILDRHAVATGTIYPIGTYKLHGEPPIGAQGHWIDQDAQIEPVKAKVVAAEAEKSGIILRMHPGYVGGQNTIEALTAFFQWLAAERDAGRIDVVTLSQWALTRIQA